MSRSAAVRAATPPAIAEAARLLRQGRLVAFPTETVYGLGADAWDDVAVATVFATKGRPRLNPLIVHVVDGSAAAAEVEVDDRARRLMTRFWPGPLTLVLPRRATSRLSRLVSAGLDTIAVRAPRHPIALSLLRACGRPIAAPSANPSGAMSPTTAADVAAGLGDRVPLILDGGPCSIGVESTVLDLTTPLPTVLRPGGVTEEELSDAVGSLARLTGPADRPRSPGLMSRHYAPRHPLRLNAIDRREGEILLGFGPSSPAGSPNLSPSGDLTEAAARLFAMLHQLDRGDVSCIAVMPIPETGLGRAINDRLRRAAAPVVAAVANTGDWNGDRGPAAPCMLPDDDADGSSR